ncbi:MULTISPECIES: hypothetical protein [Arthrobacter]|uniref:DUF3592 domain-containing protein n=1 Tax=Arthrobacter oryzae TaxID=409290 RepID=A0A3N0C8K8_9MICC|nr:MULTISPECIES: hypothetical protein [Arthrobacter]QYF90688.1 hypothetical protein KY499_05300 [Arthrobacter sp. PAMC25284]RNL59086.1 hypothetical protein D7003_03000 [Arthrobacter oryzae]
MPEPAEFLGPVLELMSWVAFVPGIPLLIVGWAITKRRCPWTTATAEVYEAGGFKGFRWSDDANTPHLSLHTAEQTRGLETGDEILLYYDICHPARWSIRKPRNDNPVLAVGWILTAVGILCTLAGFVLMMF